ncbi:DUF3467 domain-containing protein [Oryzobacter sp. R7]|uniref:DUF3467 domain-containing protein n=1 Tax=Oryzobacter faecalis TaxID=3388656 RepID=UPI00398D0648
MPDDSTFRLPELPEYYTDATKIGVSPYGFVFEFGLMTQSPGEAKAQAIVRMSPQHTFVFYQLLKKNLREYQKNMGGISLPEEMLKDLGIEEEV